MKPTNYLSAILIILVAFSCQVGFSASPKMETKDLGGVWSVCPQPLDCIGPEGFETVQKTIEGWIPSQVPGEIHLDLMNAGQMEEPCFGDNMPNCRWPETKSWWYKTTIQVDEDFISFERQRIVFDGLDYYAQIFLNGELLGESANAFLPAEFDVKWKLKPGGNELMVRLTVGSELVTDDSKPGQWNAPHKPDYKDIPQPASKERYYDQRHWYGNKQLRKPQFSYGWDWVDTLPNIGIWRGVRLEGRSYAVLDDIRLDTIIKEGKVSLEMESIVENLHPWSERGCVLRLQITPPDGEKPLAKE